MKMISIVVPVFNEAHNLLVLIESLQAVFKQMSQYQVEYIFINDGSYDDSWHILRQFSNANESIKAINLSRNFGHQIALSAGYDVAMGSAIISMDADMQDSPEIIIEMLKAWEQGIQIVYARRIDRNDSFFKKITAQLYYKFLEYIADVSIPRDVGDFRLIDKKVLEALKHCREKSRYLRGMVAWTGYKCAFVDFKRPNRYAGITSYTWKKMIKLACDGVTSFSLFPLKIAAFMGLFVVITGILMFLYITIDALFFHVHYPLFKWLVTTIYIFMGVQFLLLWLIGEYIGRIFEEQKGRPLYIISEKINF